MKLKIKSKSENNEKVRARDVAFLIFLAAVSLSLFGCGKKDDIFSGGSSRVSLQFTENLASNSVLDFLIPSAHAALNDVRMCFKRLRFKLAHESTSSDVLEDEDNIDFELEEVVFGNVNTPLTTVSIPAGNYTRVELDLEKDCNGYSVLVDNDSGSFQTEDRITIKFEGTFVADEAEETLALSVDQVLDALDTVTSSDQLKSTLEGVSGSI